MLKKIIVDVIQYIVFGSLRSPEAYVKRLRRNGIEIGEGSIFFDPKSTIVDAQNPKLIKIGRNVRVTAGCKILSHDFSWSVIGGIYGQVLGAVGTVNIGDNVFIGMNTVILRNTDIGDNVIIGAGSVVTGKVDSNSVYAGVPAKKIMTIEEFYKKRLSNVKKDIENITKHINMNDKKEIWQYLREYVCFFEDAPLDLKIKQMVDTGYYEKCEEFYKKNGEKFHLNDFV